MSEATIEPKAPMEEDMGFTQPAESSLRARLNAAKATAPEAEAEGASIFGAFDDASLA